MSKKNPYEASKPRVLRAEDEKNFELVTPSEDIEVEEAEVLEAKDEEDFGLAAPSEGIEVEEAEVLETEEVPEGTVKEILSWVDEDKSRAELALATEKSSKSPRATLIKLLRNITEGGLLDD